MYWQAGECLCRLWEFSAESHAITDIVILPHAGNLDLQDCSPADIALSLCRMVSYNVAQVCYSTRADPAPYAAPQLHADSFSG
jgi:hypothetical protein